MENVITSFIEPGVESLHSLEAGSDALDTSHRGSSANFEIAEWCK